MVDPSRELRRWRKSSGLSLEKIAARVGCNPGALWYWMEGKRTPQLGAALAVQKLTGIPVAAWWEQAEKKTAAKARKRRAA